MEERERDRVRRYGGDESGGRATGESGTLRNASSNGSSDDFGEWLNPSDERRVMKETGLRYSSPPWPEIQDQPSTPLRKVQKTNEFSTPSSKRKQSHIEESERAKGLPTPMTGGGRVKNASEYGYNESDPFSTPCSLRTGSGSLFGIRSPSHTPQPSHMRQPDYPDLPQASRLREEEDISTVTANPYDLTPDILALLQEEGISLPSNTEQKLKNLVGKHAMRVSGIAKGRDITRVALKAKDVKIAELGVRIGQLETEREIDRRVLKGLRAEREGTKRR